MKLKFIINLHRRIELKEIKLLIPTISRIYNKFTWTDEIWKKIHVKKRSPFFKRKKKRLKYEFKLKAKFFFIRFMHHIIILHIFKNAYINIIFARNHRLFFSLFIYFYAIILNKYYTHILSFTYFNLT